MKTEYLILPVLLTLFFTVMLIQSPSIYTTTGFSVSVLACCYCLYLINSNRDADLEQFQLKHQKEVEELSQDVKFMQDKVSGLALGKTITGRSRR